MTSPPIGRVVDLSSDAPEAPRLRILGVAALWLLGWSALVVAMGALVSAQKSVPFRYTVASEALNYYTLAAASLVVWWANARLVAARWRWPAQAAAHLAVGLVLVGAWQTIYGLHLRSMIGPRAWHALSRDSGLFQLMNACVFYAGVVAATLAVQAARRARAHERRQHELALLARDAELRALTAQLEPHFLLNTLNSILALVDEHPGDARAMLERLAELLTAAFDGMRDADVTLGRELDLVAAYLAIEQIRFGHRLDVTIDVPDALRTVRVPSFVLQPLVENSIKYAVAPRVTPTSIAIRGRRVDQLIRVEVSDSGDGFERDAVGAGSEGLALTERRLQAFAPGAHLTVERAAAGGCTVALTFPPLATTSWA